MSNRSQKQINEYNWFILAKKRKKKEKRKMNGQRKGGAQI